MFLKQIFGKTAFDKLIVCLGNPGSKYSNNRHNAGYIIGDKIINTYDLSPSGQKFKAIIYKGLIDTKKVLLAKPQTYMNLSGESVQLICAFFKIKYKDIIVITDDFEIPLETIRIRTKGSAGTHNGLKSIIQTIGTQEFPRIRIGIGPKPENYETSNFVLSDFKKEELEKIDAVSSRIIDALKIIIAQNIQKAMNQFNAKAPT